MRSLAALVALAAALEASSDDDPVVAQARRQQCPDTTIPMPCPDRTTPIFALHIPKTGGRSLWTLAERASGQALCEWAPMRFAHYKQSLAYAKNKRRKRNVPPDFGDPDLFEGLVARRAAGLRAAPCLTTYEAGWRATRAFGAAVPAVATMVREPTSWRLSVVDHGRERGRHGGADALLAAGCLAKRGDACGPAAGAPLLLSLTAPTQPLLLTSDGRLPAPDAPSAWTASSLAEAKAHLAASVFGVVDYFPESACLFAYQFGTFGSGAYDAKTCACPRGSRNRWASKARAENVSAAALRALGSLQRGADADFYAYALSLFFDRARAFERATGTRLLCDDDDAHWGDS